MRHFNLSLVLFDLLVRDGVEGILGVWSPVDHGVVLEVALNNAFRCSADDYDVIPSSANVSVLWSRRKYKNELLIVWTWLVSSQKRKSRIICISTWSFWASSQLTPSRMCDWGPALMPPWRRFSLICFCFCLNSFDDVPIGTNWWAISSFTGVLLCVGEPSGTHWWKGRKVDISFSTCLYQLIIFIKYLKKIIIIVKWWAERNVRDQITTVSV